MFYAAAGRHTIGNRNDETIKKATSAMWTTTRYENRKQRMRGKSDRRIRTLLANWFAIIRYVTLLKKQNKNVTIRRRCVSATVAKINNKTNNGRAKKKKPLADYRA